MICSKMDLVEGSERRLRRGHGVSAHTGAGLAELRSRLDSICFGDAAADVAFALNSRHLKAIAGARSSLLRAKDFAGSAPELLAVELREALDRLGEISGKITPDDVLGRIFSSFCIGK